MTEEMKRKEINVKNIETKEKELTKKMCGNVFI